MDGARGQISLPAGAMPGRWASIWRLRGIVFVIAYLVLTYGLAQSSLNIQALALVAAVFAILAISLDLVAGMLGLYSLGQGGFFAIGAYLTTIAATQYDVDIFLLLPITLVATGVTGGVIGAMSLRVSGLYFAITTFVFTLVLTVLATDLSITGGLQGLLGPAFPDFPDSLQMLGTPVAWCVMLALLVAIALAWNIRKSPLYPVLLSIRDAEPFAEAAGVRTKVIKVGLFGVSAAMAGLAGWLFSFLGVVSPGQFDWAVSLNILVMVLVGGINTTLGPILGAIFVTMFPAVVNIDPWIQEILYGALSIFAITVFPEGVVGLVKRRVGGRFKALVAAPAAGAPPAALVFRERQRHAPTHRPIGHARLERLRLRGTERRHRRRRLSVAICARYPTRRPAPHPRPARGTARRGGVDGCRHPPQSGTGDGPRRRRGKYLVILHRSHRHSHGQPPARPLAESSAARS